MSTVTPVCPVRTGPNEYAIVINSDLTEHTVRFIGPNEYTIIVNSDLTEHTARFIGTPDQLMKLAGQITTVARAIKSKEYSS